MTKRKKITKPTDWQNENMFTRPRKAHSLAAEWWIVELCYFNVTQFCQGWTVTKTKANWPSCIFCVTVLRTDLWTLRARWAVRLVLVENFCPLFSGHNNLDPHFCTAWQVLSQGVCFWQRPINQTDTLSWSPYCSNSVGYFKTELLEVTNRKYFVLHKTQNFMSILQAGKAS